MEKTKEELILDVNKKLAELNEMEDTTSTLKSNVNEFLCKDKIYKVHKPVAFEKDLINKERMKKYIEFLQEPSYLFRKQLIDLLKKKGVDIVKLEKENETLYVQEKELLKVLAKEVSKSEIEKLKNKIENIRDQQRNNFYQREELLKYCIEKQLEDFVRFYLLYTVLEVKTNEKWEKVYKSYEDFKNSDDDLLLGRAAQVLAAMVYNDNL